MARKKYAKLSLLIGANANAIYEAFVEPGQLRRFWLKRSSGPLRVGEPVRWDFMVPGASAATTAETLVPGERIVFRWPDGVRVRIVIEKRSRMSSVVRVAAGPFASTTKAVDTAEGFCIVLCDLKVFLESGKSPGLVKAKAELIAG